MKKYIILLILVIFPMMVFALPTGDVDGNGKVGSSDYVLVRKHILGQSLLTGDKLTRADVNNDGKVSSLDFVSIRKTILNGGNTATPVPTGTPTPQPKQKVTLTFVGGDIVTTGYEGKEVLIKGGKVSEHSSLKNNSSKDLKLNLKKNQIYAVSFDYQTKSGSNKFDVDIYPDKISKSYPSKASDIQVNLEAKSSSQHYDWFFASDDSKIEGDKVALRFFDDIYDRSKDRSKSNEKDVTINNILMSRVTTKDCTEGSCLGVLQTPSRKGYKFAGWYTSSTGGTKITSESQITKSMTLYARWTGYYEHVFILGVDGLGDTFRPDKTKKEPNNKVDAKNFRRIFGDYAYRYDANTENITISAQNWTSIFNGVTCETHGITNQIASDKKRTTKNDNLTVFYYIRKQMPNAKLASIVNWNPINHGIIESDIGVDKMHPGDDTKVTSKTIDYIKSNKNNLPTLLFVHLCDVDHAAHATQGTCATCGGYSKKYYDQAQVADGQIGKMFDAYNKTGAMNNSLFIIVADHGESKVSHGTKKGKNRDPEEEHVVLAVRGYTVNKMTLPSSVHNRDVSAIVLYALGIDKPEHFVSSVPSGLFNK